MDLDVLYLACLLLGLPFSLMSGIMALLCGAIEATTDRHSTEVPSQTHPSHGMLSAFRPTLVSSFITCFGALGLLFNRCPLTSPAWISIPLSLLGSLGVTGTAVSLVWSVFSPARLDRLNHGRIKTSNGDPRGK